MEIGLSYVFAATLTETDGVASYSGGVELAEAVDANIDIKFEKKKFYSNNKVSAIRRKFKEGTIKLGVDDLDQAGLKLLCGGVETLAGITGETTLKEIANGGSDTAPFVGVGICAKKAVGTTDVYRAIWLRKVQFDPPVDDLKTEGESIEFKNPSIVGDIQETVAAAGEAPKYKDEVTVDTEAKAIEWLKDKAGITA